MVAGITTDIENVHHLFCNHLYQYRLNYQWIPAKEKNVKIPIAGITLNLIVDGRFMWIGRLNYRTIWPKLEAAMSVVG